MDDSQNLYASSTYPSVVDEYYSGGGTFAYTNNVINPSGVAALAGSSPAIDVANGGLSGYNELLTFQQGYNQSASFNDPNLATVQSVTVDAAGDTFVGGVSNQSSPEVDLVQGSYGPVNLGLQLSSAPTGITIDQAGNLLVTQSDGVAVFAPGQTSPTSWIGYGLQPFGLAFGNNGNWLYVVANGYPCYFSCVNVYSYPAGSRIGQYSLPGSSSYFGIALSPRVPLFSPSAMRHRHPHFRYWTDLRRGVRKK